MVHLLPCRILIAILGGNASTSREVLAGGRALIYHGNLQPEPFGGLFHLDGEFNKVKTTHYVETSAEVICKRRERLELTGPRGDSDARLRRVKLVPRERK